MKFVGKSLNEHFAVSRRFLAIIFFLQMISVVWRLSGDYYTSGIQNLLLLIGLFVIARAGRAAAGEHGFNLKQTAFVGFLLSFGTHWALPIFHSAWEVLYLFSVNAVLFSVIAAFGGWLAEKIDNP